MLYKRYYEGTRESDIISFAMDASVIRTKDYIVSCGVNKQYDEKPVLHWIARWSYDSKIISCFLDNGADVNKLDINNWLPLHAAASGNENPEVISVLLKKMHAVNEKDVGDLINMHDNDGMTPLHVAVRWNNLEVVSALLDDDNINIHAMTVHENTPLHCAAKWNSKVVEILLAKGSNPKAKNEDGKTAYDLIKENKKLKNTAAYRKLHNLSFGK